MISSLTFTISYGVNDGLILSSSELKDLYLFGVPIKSKDGSEIKNETIETFIRFAQTEVENFLGIKLLKTKIVENKSYFLDDYKNWSFIKTSLPVLAPISLDGKIGEVTQVKFPHQWLSAKKSNVESYNRRINLIPNQGGDASGIGVTYRGGLPYWGLTSYNYIPQYWEVSYLTGFNKVPYDLMSFISKYAAINVFFIASDLILGAGIGNYSLGIDGLSQSLSTQGLDKRIQGYLADLVAQKPNLVSKYKGINFISC